MPFSLPRCFSPDSSSLLARIDPKTNKVTGAIPTGNKPCSGLAAGFGSLWVPNCGDQTLSRVDLKSGEVKAAIPTGIANSEGGIAIGAGSVWLMTDDKGTLARFERFQGKAVCYARLRKPRLMSDGPEVATSPLSPIGLLDYWAKRFGEYSSASEWDDFCVDFESLIRDLFGQASKNASRLFHICTTVWSGRKPDDESEARRKLDAIHECLAFATNWCLEELGNALLQQAALSVKSGSTSSVEDLVEQISELNSIQPILIGNLGHQCLRFFLTDLQRPYPFSAPSGQCGPDRLFPRIDLSARGLPCTNAVVASSSLDTAVPNTPPPPIPSTKSIFVEYLRNEPNSPGSANLPLTEWRRLNNLNMTCIAGALDVALASANSSSAVPNAGREYQTVVSLGACLNLCCSSYSLELRHLWLLRAHLEAMLGNVDSANRLGKQAVDIARRGPPLTTGDRHRLQVLVNALPTGAVLQEIIAAVGPLIDQPVVQTHPTLIQEVQSFVQTDILDQARFDAFADRLRKLTAPETGADISPIRNSLLARFVEGRKRIGTRAKPEDPDLDEIASRLEPPNRQDKFVLTQKALQLNRLYRVLPLDDLDRFEALCAFVDCVGYFPQILHAQSLRSELHAVITQGRDLGERLFPSPLDLNAISAKRAGRLYGHYAELHRTLVLYSFVESKREKHRLLQTAIHWFERAIEIGNTSPRVYCCSRIAKCHEQLGDLDAAVESLRPVAVALPGNGVNASYARGVCLKIAGLRHRLGVSRLRKGEPDAAWICFFEAEQSIAEAASCIARSDDVLKSACKSAGNISLHLWLARMRLERLAAGDEEVPSPWEQVDRFLDASSETVPQSQETGVEVHVAKSVTTTAIQLRDEGYDKGALDLLDHVTSRLQTAPGRLMVALARYCIQRAHDGRVEQVLRDDYRLDAADIQQITDASADAVASLFSDEGMKGYVMQSVVSLKRGTAGPLGSELKSLLRLRQIIPSSRSDTPLKRLLMEVHSATGNEADALALADEISERKRDSPQWRAMTLLRKGQLLQGQGRLAEATEAFEEAFVTGGNSAPPLILAAAGFRLSGQFQKARDCLYKLMDDPEQDQRPEVTRSQWAKLMWAEFKASPERPEADQEIAHACHQLEMVLEGHFVRRHRHDYGCIADLVEMLEHPAACAAMVRLLQNTSDPTMIHKLGLALGAPFHYVDHAPRSFGRSFEQRELPAAFVDACIQRFGTATLKPSLEKAFAPLIVIILVQTYFRGGMAGRSFAQLAEGVFRQIATLPEIASRRRRVSLLLGSYPHSILGEVVVAYVSKAMQVLSQLLGDVSTARGAVESAEFRSELRSFLSPATARQIRPASFRNTDVVELEPLLREVIQSVQTDSRERLQSASELHYEVARKGFVSFESWQCLRQHVRLMLDIDNPKSPLQELAERVASWRTRVVAFFNSISISTELSRIEDPDPRGVWKAVQSAVRGYLRATDIEDTVKANFINSGDRLIVQFTITVSKSEALPPSARPCESLLASLEQRFKKGIEGGSFQVRAALTAGELVRNDADFVRVTAADWVAVLFHVFDGRYSIVADWLFGPSRTARQAGRHPRMAFHDLSKLLPQLGTSCNAEQLASIRRHAAMATYTILRVLHQETHGAPPMSASLSAAVARATAYISDRCPDASVEAILEPDLMVAMDRNILDSIVINLAHNCVQAITRGNTERRVRIEAHRDKGRAEITFENPFDVGYSGPSEGSGIGKGEIKYLVESVAGGHVLFPPLSALVSPYRVTVTLPVPRYDNAGAPE